MKCCLERVPNNVDKREGSIIYDALSASVAELAQLYIEVDWALDQCFADTAEREYLVRRAKERGLEPDKPTYAVLKGVFDAEIPLGSRFSLGEHNYRAIEVIDNAAHTYKIECETIGKEGNRYFGKLIPIEPIRGLKQAELMELLIPAEGEEETEAFRERYINSFHTKAFGGNKADYKEKIKGITGIGGCKVYRTTNMQGEKQGGHVTCVIINSEYETPSEVLIKLVQDRIDPEISQGEGDGLAPCGHMVHIVPVTETIVTIETEITYQNGYNFELIKSYLEQAVGNYFLELNKSWEESENLIVRVAQIESRILQVKGVMDIRNTKLNEKKDNLILGKNTIAKRGEIVG